MEAVRTRTRALHAALTAGLCLALVACGGGGESGAAPSTGGQSVDELYAAAQKAGEQNVVVYGIKTQTACYDVFSQKFPGITVQTQYIVGETQAKLQQEHVSGQNVADVLRTGDTTMIALIDDGILAEFHPQSATGYPAEAIGPQNAMINDSQRLSGLAYNAASLPAAQAPRSWKDLVDPRFSGRIVMPDPTSPGAGLSVLQALLGTGAIDENWLRALAADKPALLKGVQPAVEALKTGEYQVMLGGLDQITGPDAEKGTQIHFVFPVQGATPLTKHYIGVITNAPHPNAARLLETWLLSEDGQNCLAQKEREYPVRPGIAPPPGLPALSDLQNLGVQKPASAEELDKQRQLLSLFQKTFRS